MTYKISCYHQIQLNFNIDGGFIRRRMSGSYLQTFFQKVNIGKYIYMFFIMISAILTLLTLFSKTTNAEELRDDNFRISFNDVDTTIICSLLRIKGSTAICNWDGDNFLLPVENIKSIYFIYLGKIYEIQSLNNDTIELLNLTTHALENEHDTNQFNKNMQEYRMKEKFIVNDHKRTLREKQYNNRESCYSLGKRYGRCAMLSLLGQECESSDDIVISARCRNQSETEKGIKAGMSQVKAD